LTARTAPAGTLPSNWSEAGAFPSLTSLDLTAPLAGTLPASWGSNGSFPALTLLQLGGGPGVTPLSGSLPAEWGSPTAWQGLRYLTIANASITGGHDYAAIIQCLKYCCCELVISNCLSRAIT